MRTNHDWATPFERGNGNQTAGWQECIAFHQRLAQAFAHWLKFEHAGRSDGGAPIHVGVFSSDGVFDPPVVFRRRLHKRPEVVCTANDIIVGIGLRDAELPLSRWPFPRWN